LEDVGREVTLMGWVRTHRDHGGVVFLDLWDREGMTQVVADPAHDGDAHALAQTLRAEYVVAVRGRVRRRPPDTENPALATGRVEVLADEIRLLNAARPLPFPLHGPDGVDEAVRLRYRYLDLRRDALQRNLRLRHEVVRAMREGLYDEGFLEVETPMLTRSTPEGARDYLVPSRVHAGSFYALPQSPQQMKQLLMVAGVDRYFQIARCFRDEDLRADRQPEFTQLDLEMSFVDRDAVLALVEALVVAVVRSVAPRWRVTTPFPRLTHAESLARYGTDKPDLRWAMPFVDVSEVVAQSAVRFFRETVAAGGCVKGLRVTGGDALTRRDLDELKALCQAEGAEGLLWGAYDGAAWRAPVAKHMAPEEIAALLAAFEAAPGDVLFLVADDGDTVARALGALRKELAERLGRVAPDALAFAWIVDFPLLAWDARTRRWEAEHHPFTAPKAEDLSLLESEPGRVRGECYDLVCNGWELGSGSLRIHRREVQARVFEVLGYTPERAEASFGHLLEAFEYGAPPHGGIALGVDRFTALLAGADSIRDVIAFPKNNRAVDLTLRSPAAVSRRQLDAVHLRPKH
jgi:aspartyl-tRNA synthetase